jgi:YfiH family protein
MNLSYNVGDAEERVKQNRALFLGTVGSTESGTAFAAQCHSGTVTKVEHPGLHPSCDALYTNKKGIALAVSIADCVPILLADRGGKVIAAVHAGWRGSKQRIVSNTIGRLRQEMGVLPSDLFAYIGPSAGPCCYEVGQEVSNLFHDGTVHARGDKATLDLKFENRRQMEIAGVPASQIEVDDRCTICGPDLFHSYRRDGDASGRMLAAILLI